MGFFVIRRALAVRGGSVQLGADVNLVRDAANRLRTDDAFQVGGTANLDGATRIGGSATFAGTPFVVPYGTASPTLSPNGDLRVYHKSAVARLAFQSGGTAYVIALPTATNGTITVSVGTIP